MVQHEGDLSGFTLLRGDREQLGRLTIAPDFQRLTWRASVCLAGIGVMPALIDSGVTDTLGAWQEGIADLV